MVITPESKPADLARAAFLAHGGEKFRALQNVVMRGSAQLYPPNSVQSIPASFSLVTAGPKLSMEIDARPVFVVKQIHDGQNSYSSMPNVEMPPLRSLASVRWLATINPDTRSPPFRTRRSNVHFASSIRKATRPISSSIPRMEES